MRRNSNPPTSCERPYESDEAWWQEFSAAYVALCGQPIDGDWLAGLAATLYPLQLGCNAREAAVVAYMTLGYELSRQELQDLYTSDSRLSGVLH